MITLLTGLPGAGKSLSAIGMIRDYVKKGRKVFVYGIRDLDYSALGCEEWTKSISDWRELPAGSVLVWDELQFSQLGVPVNKFDPPPDWMKQLTLHRQHGVDFVLVTQNPAYLHSFVRKLVGLHIHLLRKFGLNASYRYEWDEVQADPTKNRSKAVIKLWKFPKENYKFYKSAEVHTVQRRIPRRLVVAAVCVVLACVAAVYGVKLARGVGQKGDDKKRVVAKEEKPPASHSLLGSLGGRGEHVMTTEEYLKRSVPRVEGEPWSAPMFDKREIAVQPEIYCVNAVDDDRCQCYTEQLTKLHVEKKACAAIAKDGVYNPYRKPKVDREFSDRVLGRDGLLTPIQASQGLFPIRELPAIAFAPESVNGAGAPSGEASVQKHHRALSDSYSADVFGPKTTQY